MYVMELGYGYYNTNLRLSIVKFKFKILHLGTNLCLYLNRTTFS